MSHIAYYITPGKWQYFRIFSQRVFRERFIYGNIFYFYRDIINQAKVRGNKLSFCRSQDIQYAITFAHEIYSCLQQIQLQTCILTANALTGRGRETFETIKKCVRINRFFSLFVKCLWNNINLYLIIFSTQSLRLHTRAHIIWNFTSK